MNLSAVRSAIANAASSVTPTLNAYAYVPDAASVPGFYVGGLEIDYDLTNGRGSDNITFSCLVFVSATSDQSGQAQLNDYLNGSGSSSLKTALESDPTLAGASYTVEVARAQNYGFHRIGEATYLGAELVVNVSGRGA